MRAVRRLSLLGGAAEATGLAVIIDVLRAGSFACYALGAGASRIVAVSEVDEALDLKSKNPEWLLAGERGGVPPAGFDLGNSPSSLPALDLSGRTLIHCTSAGTRGVEAASRTAARVVLGCFANAAAVTKLAAGTQAGVVSLVSMGTEGLLPADEDEALADYLEAVLDGGRPDPRPFVVRACSSQSGLLFRAGDRPGRPGLDLFMCTALNRFDFVPAVTGYIHGHPVITRG